MSTLPRGIHPSKARNGPSTTREGSISQNPGTDVAGKLLQLWLPHPSSFEHDLPCSQRLFETTTQVLQHKRRSYNYDTIALLIQCTLIPVCIDIHDTDFYYTG